uniref:Uncharacterized protein n=1 Tax=Glossina pallidipes TaxID=7398 RepID=A0A1A9ZQB0_GLOPL
MTFKEIDEDVFKDITLQNSLPTREAYNCRKCAEPMPPYLILKHAVYDYSSATAKSLHRVVNSSLTRDIFECFLPVKNAPLPQTILIVLFKLYEITNVYHIFEQEDE